MTENLSPRGEALSPDAVAVSPGVAAVSPQPVSAGWNVAEVVALLSLAAVSIAAFSWSAIALHGVAVMSGIPSGLAWGAPVIVDGPIIQAAFSLVALNRRAKLGVPIPTATRRFFWIELAAAELVSLVGNGVHAWTSDGLKLPQLAAAAVAGAAPVAALAVTHALTALLEVPRTPSPEEATAVAAVASAGDSTATPGDTAATVEVEEATPEPFDPAAERDAEVWRLHKSGLSYREIAPIIGVHPGTVGKVVNRLKAEQSDPAADQSLHLVAGGTTQLALPSSN
ncbi:hypothetical protein [Nocardia xishanensis]|uniref:hypothetical protein n=1 Tax=Nocardia xishanensis TaxID=238964 RepID=UPI00082F86CF|nr:hypothetical protein [Nocardia xishanensis]